MKNSRRILALVLSLVLCLSLFAGCGGEKEPKTDDVKSGVEDGVLTVAMECSYAPYNWTQSDDSNGTCSQTPVSSFFTFLVVVL